MSNSLKTRVKITELHSPLQFVSPTDHKVKRYFNVTSRCDNGTTLFFQVREDNYDEFMFLRVDDEVEVTIKVSSHRNSKNPELYFHKLILDAIH